VSPSNLFLLVVVPFAAIGLAVVFGIVAPRIRRKRRLHSPITITFSPITSAIPRPIRPGTPEHVATASPPPTASAAQGNPHVHVAAATGTDGAPLPDPRASETRSVTESRATTAEPHLRLEPMFLEPPAPPRADQRSPTSRKVTRHDGTLQFVPGRFEIIEGRDIGHEIRFVRQPGDQTTVVTFGRNEGPLYRHVQLHEPTVSRLHAKMSLEEKRWRLTNMSQTNPVVVNGTPMNGEGATHLLSEGDRVEMGEVVLRFHAK
jgi:hypothetical protein